MFYNYKGSDGNINNHTVSSPKLEVMLHHVIGGSHFSPKMTKETTNYCFLKYLNGRISKYNMQWLFKKKKKNIFSYINKPFKIYNQTKVKLSLECV